MIVVPRCQYKDNFALLSKLPMAWTTSLLNCALIRIYVNDLHCFYSNFIHRDLATRNILVHADECTGEMEAKIADFGLSR